MSSCPSDGVLPMRNTAGPPKDCDGGPRLSIRWGFVRRVNEAADSWRTLAREITPSLLLAPTARATLACPPDHKESAEDPAMPSSTTTPSTHYRWIIVAAGGVLGCVAIGGLFSLPVFLRPIAQDTGWSTTGISTAMTLAFIALAVGSIGWGTLSDRVGPRAVVLGGS